jgi:hypothetical protein
MARWKYIIWIKMFFYLFDLYYFISNYNPEKNSLFIFLFIEKIKSAVNLDLLPFSKYQ